MKSLLITTLSLLSTSALAHSGHMANDFVHGFLHAEHVIMLGMIGATLWIVNYFRK